MTTTALDGPALATRPALVLLGLVRIVFGWVMLWAGLDKVFGLGFATPAERSVLSGVSPTKGYLGNLDGPAASVMGPLAGNVVVDVLFVGGLVLGGLALLLGVATRVAGIGAALIFAPLWFTSLPLANNPVVDQHLVYVLVGLLLAFTPSGTTLGLGAVWARLPFVRDHAWLR
ncbi:DoxX family membrane protein [Lentzea sp. NPDC058436]|uniref:DoxX family membrane protein n=1 Tax=Lentzea sp. NPDC058436 TaxID=3346499 RepID=UPI00365BDE55